MYRIIAGGICSGLVGLTLLFWYAFTPDDDNYDWLLYWGVGLIGAGIFFSLFVPWLWYKLFHREDADKDY